MNQQKELISNRRAHHDYEILETFEAGIVLLGTEIKSLRNHGGNMQEGYVMIDKGEIWLRGSSIIPYSHGGTHFNHEEKRDRKLLMHKKEIARLKEAVSEKGLTLIPLSLYLSSGRVKVKIALAKGKKQHDKRATIKKKEIERELRNTKYR